MGIDVSYVYDPDIIVSETICFNQLQLFRYQPMLDADLYKHLLVLQLGLYIYPFFIRTFIINVLGLSYVLDFLYYTEWFMSTQTTTNISIYIMENT